MRGLLTGVFCAVLVLAVAAASDPAEAKRGKKCTEVKAPFCLPPLLVPVCSKKAKCGCQAWTCTPIFAAK